MTIIKKLSIVILCATMAIPALNCSNPIVDHLKKINSVFGKPEIFFGSTLISTGLPLWLHGRRVKFALSKYPGAVLIMVGLASIADSYQLITIEPSKFQIK